MLSIDSLPFIRSHEAPRADTPALWRAQAGWRASELADTDWRIDIPRSLGEDLLARAARARTLAEAAADWVPDAEAAALRARIEAMLEGGVGFALMRGLQLSGTAEVDERAALLFGLLFGRPVSQTRKGNLVARVEDLGHDLRSPNVRGHQTAADLAFHCDRADRVLLVCVRPAQTGGRSRVVSARALADTLQAEAPELARRLYRPLPQDRRGEEGAGERPYSTMPVFHDADGVFVARYLRRFIEDSQRHPDAPRLDDRDRAALDALDALLERDGMALEMPFEPGDVQILNNNVVFHARTAFTDHPDPARRRLLLRLWLTHASARPLPAGFADLYGRTEAGAFRGGVWPDGRAPAHDPRDTGAVAGG